MKILVTGSSGFIGSKLISHLLQKNHVVDGISRHKSKSQDTFKISLKDKNILNEQLKRNNYDAVIHLAALVPKSADSEPIEMLNNNCQSTLNLLESCRKNNVKRFVFASTHLVYGNTKYLPIDENHPLNPKTNYALSKLIAENICKVFFYSYGIETLILRISSIYGSGQPEIRIIPSMIQDCLKNKIITIHEYKNGFQIMDLIHVMDVCRSLEMACRTKIKFGTYNIANGTPVIAQDIARLLSKITGINAIKIKKFDNETNHFFYDISRASSDLGFRPIIQLNEKTLKSILLETKVTDNFLH